MQGCSGIIQRTGSRVLGEARTSSTPGAIAWKPRVGARAHQLPGSNPDYSTGSAGSAAAWIRETKQLSWVGEEALDFLSRPNTARPPPAGKRLFRGERALGKWCVVSGGCIPASLQDQLGAVLQPGARQRCVTADSLPLFPCLPKTAWAPLNSLLGAHTAPARGQALLGRGFIGSSQHRAGRAVCALASLVPCPASFPAAGTARRC